MNKKTLLQGLAVACLFALLTAPLAARAAGLSPTDSHFLQAAAASNAFQVQAAGLASERAASTEVRTFAGKMQSRYQGLDADLRRLARDKQVSLPVKAEPVDQRTLDELAGNTGAAFDALYVEQVALRGHEKTETLYRTAAGQGGGDADVRDFAARHQSALADHLTLARALKRDPAANPERMPPATRGEPAPVSPAERTAPASVAPAN